jgi:5-methylcytosine-specific restriction endonuclease McrA
MRQLYIALAEHWDDEGDPIWRGKRPIPQRLALAVKDRDGHLCQSCGTRDDLAVDHLIPESKGGPMVMENLQTLCRSCNSSKGSRL